MTHGTGRSCLFCGAKPVGNEHVFPQWFSEWLKTDRGAKRFHMDTSDWGKRTAHIFDLKSRWFCYDCNSGWMNQMEAPAKPLLKAMAFDTTPRTLTVDDQAELARWAFKTMLTLLRTRPRGERPPPEMYEAFRLTETPLSVVWIGWAETPSRQAAQYSIRAGQRLGVGAIETTNFYQVLLLIGSVFFGSFYAHHPEVVVQYNFPREFLHRDLARRA